MPPLTTTLARIYRSWPRRLALGSLTGRELPRMNGNETEVKVRETTALKDVAADEAAG